MKARLVKITDGMYVAERKQDITTINRLAASILSVDLTPARICKYTDEELKLLHIALRKTAFYSPDDEEYVSRQETAFKEKVRRGKYDEEDVEDMVSAFLSARMFEQARSLKSQFHKMRLPEIPEEVSLGNTPQAALWRVYGVSGEGGKLDLKTLSLSSGPKIVTVISPGCGAMESAMKTIFADSELGPIFRANSVMITRRSDFAGVEDVKKLFGFAEVYIVHKSLDFPGFKLQSSPRFYFLKDGKAIYDFRGWGDENNSTYSKKQIRKGLSAIGLI